jgi:hypothetical protein
VKFGLLPIPVHVEVTPSMVDVEVDVVGDNAPVGVIPDPDTEY